MTSHRSRSLGPLVKLAALHRDAALAALAAGNSRVLAAEADLAVLERVLAAQRRIAEADPSLMPTSDRFSAWIDDERVRLRTRLTEAQAAAEALRPAASSAVGREEALASLRHRAETDARRKRSAPPD